MTLYAGEKRKAKSFIVYKNFAGHYFSVLKVTFNRNFIESQNQEYRLDEDTEEVVRLLVQWFYTQTLDIRQLEEELESGLKKDEDLALSHF
jgi:hypothetical protein